MRIKKSAKHIKAVSNYLYQISRIKHDSLPLGEIMEELEKTAHLMVVQEDGTRWEGFICGREGHTTFPLVDWVSHEHIVNSLLAFQWYRHENGRYEINAYLS